MDKFILTTLNDFLIKFYNGVLMSSIEFQLIDADYFMNGNKPIIRLFGRKQDGKSACVFVTGFDPYFYVKGDIKKIFSVMGDDKQIKDLEEVEKFLAIGYHDKKAKLVKVICYSPKDVRGLREKYEQEDFIDKTYESDILFKYRFLVDNNIHGMDWLSMNVNKIYTQTTKCDTYETDVRESEIKILNKIENSDLKYMSFDLECISTESNRMATGKYDPIIMISCVFSHEFRGKKKHVICAKHTKLDDKDIVLKCFSEEKDMLEEFQRIIMDYDPDILTGYNINGFDIPFILERLRINNLPCALGRTPDFTYVRSYGPNNESVISGRVVVDSFQLLRRDVYVRLPRYDLGTVAKIMLDDEKLDVKHKDMEKHWNSLKGTQKLIRYCAKDSELALDLLFKKRLLDKFFELSKVSGVLLQDSLGGQSARIEIRILHEFRDTEYVLPTKPNDAVINKRVQERKKKGLKGATVLEPDKGLHTKGCTLILDFKSLYPSLIITYNLSPDTLITEESPELKDDEKHVSPLNDIFVDSKVHKGMLPRILEKLLESRAHVKKLMSEAKNDHEKAILDARQSALKILLNSFYGYTGYLKARLYVMAVAGGVTAYGRDNLIKTEKLIKDKYGLSLSYGDTDSVFVATKEEDLDKAKQLGDEISKYVTDNLPGVLDLEFEKIYRTFLILTKKRYAGWSFVLDYSSGKMKWKDKIEMKGIETVRRDWCPLVSDALNEIIEIILKQGDIQKAVDFIKNIIINVKENKIEIEELVVVKGVTRALSAYKGIQPHIELAKRLNQRKPDEPVIVGDRIGYVITRGNEMLSKRAESVEYIKEKGLEIDSDYYIDRQLLPPVERILASMGIEKNELLGFGRQASIADIMSGKQRVMKHDINVNHNNEKKEVMVSVNEIKGFSCAKCHKKYNRPPLSGKCECGGSVGFASQKK